MQLGAIALPPMWLMLLPRLALRSAPQAAEPAEQIPHRSVPCDASDRSGSCTPRGGVQRPALRHRVVETLQQASRGTQRHAHGAARQRSRSVAPPLTQRLPPWQPHSVAPTCPQKASTQLSAARRPSPDAYRSAAGSVGGTSRWCRGPDGRSRRGSGTPRCHASRAPACGWRTRRWRSRTPTHPAAAQGGRTLSPCRDSSRADRSSPSITSTTNRARCFCGSHSSSDGGSRYAVSRSNGRKLLIRRGALGSRAKRCADAMMPHRVALSPTGC